MQEPGISSRDTGFLFAWKYTFGYDFGFLLRFSVFMILSGSYFLLIFDLSGINGQ
jgi:hypothetical protein